MRSEIRSTSSSVYTFAGHIANVDADNGGSGGGGSRGGVGSGDDGTVGGEGGEEPERLQPDPQYIETSASAVTTLSPYNTHDDSDDQQKSPSLQPSFDKSICQSEIQRNASQTIVTPDPEPEVIGYRFEDTRETSFKRHRRRPSPFIESIGSVFRLSTRCAPAELDDLGPLRNNLGNPRLRLRPSIRSNRSGYRNSFTPYILPEASISAFTLTSAMNAAAKAAGIVDTADPQADPYRDVEATPQSRAGDNHSRVSLPMPHQRTYSLASTRRGRPSMAYSETADGEDDEDEEDEDDEELEDEIPWGKEHPCYPHLNTHVPVNSPQWEKTRIIRVKRDWMLAGDMAPAFSNLYPEILDPVMPEERFRDVIEHINASLIQIYNPYRAMSWVDVGMGWATGWLWDDLGLTSTKRDLRALDTWMERWNKQYGDAEGVKLIPLRRTAYLSLDIQIPDPELGPDVAESEFDAMSRRSFDSRPPRRSGSQLGRGLGNGGSRAASNYSIPNAATSDQQASEQQQQPQPAVPQIPGKYLEEAQQQVEKHMQQRGEAGKS